MLAWPLWQLQQIASFSMETLHGMDSTKNSKSSPIKDIGSTAIISSSEEEHLLKKDIICSDGSMSGEDNGTRKRKTHATKKNIL